MMMSYEDTQNRIVAFIKNKDNDEEIRANVIDWFKDFNDAYYPKMVSVVNRLNKDNLDDEDEEFIKKFGEDIYYFGGKKLMVSLFYIMSNFMNCNDATMIKYLWNGIGEWKV
tara:strand:+ start:200 stop:535 length:336 start_codon:yes stop_codon:yes gene_type:complete